MHKLVKTKDFCCGCTACATVCPTHAITMKPDYEGFVYPDINEETCVDCGLCTRICPLQEKDNREAYPETYPEVYAIKHKSDSVRMTSASGGFFSAISDYILEHGGVVYGAVYDDQFRVFHQRAEVTGVRNYMKGSKYVQSDLGDTFIKVKKDLRSKRLVLFTGTPCQIAGLNSYLGSEYSNLVTCDIICHGTSSPKVFQDYIQYLEAKHNSKIVSFLFRDKEQGWQAQKWKCEYENGTVEIDSKELLLYKNIFYSHVALRPSCHSCPHASLNRPSDITMGDFWGIENSLPEFKDDKGVSVILLHTKKGKQIFESIADNLLYMKSDTKNCLQPNLQKPSPCSEQRESFWNDYEKYGFSYIVKKYGKDSWKTKIKRVGRKSLQKLGFIKLHQQ